jgi:hypothetical protein
MSIQRLAPSCRSWCAGRNIRRPAQCPLERRSQWPVFAQPPQLGGSRRNLRQRSDLVNRRLVCGDDGGECGRGMPPSSQSREALWPHPPSCHAVGTSWSPSEKSVLNAGLLILADRNHLDKDKRLLDAAPAE